MKKRIILIAAAACFHLVLVAYSAVPNTLASFAIEPAIVAAQPTEVEVCRSGDACENFIDKYVNPFVTLLTFSVGILAAISIVVAGIQYASAGDDASKVSKAKERIWGTIVGLVAYLLLFAFLNYIIPGGLI